MREMLSRVQRIRALRRLDMVTKTSVVEWATEQVIAGEYLPIILEVAPLYRWQIDEVDDLLERLAESLGLGPLARRQVGIEAAKHFSHALSCGDVSPIEGARQIRRVSDLVPSVEPILRDFAGLVILWEDSLSHRGAYDELIRSEALRLLGGSCR